VPGPPLVVGIRIIPGTDQRERYWCGGPDGSNSYRYRLWKAELAALAAETGLNITVCHFPPGTSKWNKIEHRLFSHITLNWRGRPLTSHEVVVKTIASTRTSTGLRVAAQLDTDAYPLGVSVSKERMQALPLAPHSWCGSWNYTIGTAAKNPAEDPDAATRHRPGSAPSRSCPIRWSRV
jgi:DDE family transposase